MRLIDADALCGEFKRRAVSARNWKERAIMEKNEEAIIRADATLAFLSEVKLTIDNAPTIERPQGEWIMEDKLYGGYGDSVLVNTCSICKTSFIYRGKTQNFCPNCGADMRVKDELNRVKDELGGRE